MAKTPSKLDRWVVLTVLPLFIIVGVYGAKTATNDTPPSQPPVVDMTEGLTPAEQASADAVHEQWLKSQQAPAQPPGEIATPSVPDVDFDRPRGGGDGWDINWCRHWWC